MGKKRQKVNWVTVDGLHWTGTEEADTPDSASPQVQAKGGKERGAGSRRTSGQGWSSNLAPRFEKKVVPASLSSPEAEDSQPKHIYYDGELCEAETLPNGFTKIRSKNLDILFKREYYEQRMATQKQLSEELNKSGAEKTSPETGSEDNDTEIISEKDMDPVAPDTPTLDKIDPDEIREFKPMNHVLEAPCPGLTPVAELEPGHAAGYSHMSSMEELPQDAFINQRPNLYLYSPSNNTLIPCEEIIIPNPVVSPETGEPVYTGPTNIYLAYPVQGPDGRSYITQPFPIHGDTVGPQGYTGGYNGYSPSVSYDSSNYYSSTPHTPNSGEDSGSGSSTQPTSPPPLVNYHPSNWFKEQQGSDYSCLEYNYPSKPSASPQPALAGSGSASGVSTEKINLREKCSHSQSSSQSSRLNNSNSSSPSLPAGAEDQPASTVTYIPGLSQEQITQSTKSQKKRKKKSKPKHEKTEWAENIKSSTMLFDLEIPTAKAEESNSDESSEIFEEKEIEKNQNQNVFEIQLTDDLADSLVNPPTDTEVTEEETVQTPPQLSEVTELETNAEETSETIDTLKAVKNVKNEVKLDQRSEDREICEITDQISTTKIENSTNFANSDEVLKSNSKNPLESDDNLSKNVQTADQETNRKAARNEKKSKQKKQKRGLKQVLNSQDGQNKCSITEPEANSEGSSCHLFKKSYSSVIKSNLQSAAPAPAGAERTETNESNCENIPPEKAEPLPPKSKTKSKTALRAEKSPIVRSDSWENIPACVVQQEETWEKSSKKRKQRNKSQVQSQSEEKQEKLEVKEEEVAEMEVNKPLIENKQCRQKTPDTEPSKVEARYTTESPPREDEGDSEKKKLKKKKKKHESGETEEASSVHRVLISDEQLLQQYTREIRRAKDVLCPSLVEKVSAAGYCDVVYVSELGSGIHRGAMGFGRLYQGKYVPPDRSDIVGDIPEDEDQTEEINEKSEDKDEGEPSDVNETELETEVCNQSASEADIDLD